MGDQYVVTGGLEYNKAGNLVELRKVTIYNDNGFERTYPDLILGRYGHACARFQNRNGDMVSMIFRDQPKFGKWPDEPNLYVLNRSRTEYRTVN